MLAMGLRIYELIGLSFAVHRKLCSIKECGLSTLHNIPFTGWQTPEGSSTISSESGSAVWP
jgi:hypothetical protein